MGIYLDNAATTFPKPESVYSAMDEAFRCVGASPGRGGYRKGIEASRILYSARESAARLLGAGDPSRLIITHSATEAVNTALWGLLSDGDHVVATSMEHNSVARPLNELGKRLGVNTTWCRGDSFGRITADDFAKAITPDTALAVVNGCSNVNGVIQPFEEIAALCRERGVLLLLDASQLAGSYPINIEEMKIDMLAAPGHKGLFGAPGTGLLYISEGISLKPLISGGTGSQSSDLLQPEILPERFESGTPNLPGIAALGAGIDFLLETGVEVIRAHELALVRRLLSGLRSIEGVTCYTPDDSERQGGAVSFTSDRAEPSTIGYKLDSEYDISVRTGLHCAPLAHRTLSTFPHGTVRVSPGWYNSDQDIDRFLEALEAILSERRL